MTCAGSVAPMTDRFEIKPSKSLPVPPVQYPNATLLGLVIGFAVSFSAVPASALEPTPTLLIRRRPEDRERLPHTRFVQSVAVATIKNTFPDCCQL